MNVVKLYSDERGFDQAKFVGEREVVADKHSAGRKTSADIAAWSETSVSATPLLTRVRLRTSRAAMALDVLI